MVDLGIQFICAVEWPPSGEDGVCDFQDAIVDLIIVRRESGDKVGDKCIPTIPKIRVGDYANSFSQLCLDGSGAGNH